MSSLPRKVPNGGKPDEPDAGDDKEDTDERCDAGPSGQRIDVDRAPPMEHHTGAHEQRPLEEGVGDNEQRSSGQGPGIEHGEPDEEQPGVRDRGEGEQALQVGLHQRHHGANQASSTPMPTSSARTASAWTSKTGAKTVQYVGGGIQAELHHHTREEHADRGRGDGMGVGEPKVERDDGALHEEAEHDEDEPTTTSPSKPSAGRPRPIAARFSAPVGAYSRACRTAPSARRRFGDGEVQRSLQRSGFLGLVPRNPTRPRSSTRSTRTC